MDHDYHCFFLVQEHLSLSYYIIYKYMAVTISTFPPCILTCKSSYWVYLPSIINQSIGLIILLKPRFNGVIWRRSAAEARDHSPTY